MNDAILNSDFLLPWAFLVASRLATRGRSIPVRAIISAVCILLGFAVGFAIDMSIIGWRFLLEPGHNPGWALALEPLVLSFIACFPVWFIFVTVEFFLRRAANRHKASTSVMSQFE